MYKEQLLSFIEGLSDEDLEKIITYLKCSERNQDMPLPVLPKDP